MSPVAWDKITLPEGMEVSDELRDRVLGVVNNTALSRTEMLSQLFSMQAEAQTALAAQISERGKESWDQLQTEWSNAIQSDPEIGGEKWTANRTIIGGILDQFGTADTRAAFDLTGAGNNPAIAKFLVKFGTAYETALAEIKLLKAKLDENPAAPPPSEGGVTEYGPGERMYKSMKK